MNDMGFGIIANSVKLRSTSLMDEMELTAFPKLFGVI
jgi:hypothetical protein